MSTLTQFFGGSGSVIKSVQRGSGSANGWTTVNITISAVDLGKATAMAWMRSTATAIDEHSMTVQLTSTTNLRLERSDGGAVTAYYTWEVVEYV